MPLALEREDLRVVHAAWVPGEVEVLRRSRDTTSELYEHFERQTQSELEMEGLRHAAQREGERWGI